MLGLVGLVGLEMLALVNSGDNMQVITGEYIVHFLRSLNHITINFCRKISKSVEAIQKMSRHIYYIYIYIYITSYLYQLLLNQIRKAPKKILFFYF